jgi:hypothetical protein
VHSWRAADTGKPYPLIKPWAWEWAGWLPGIPW